MGVHVANSRDFYWPFNFSRVIPGEASKASKASSCTKELRNEVGTEQRQKLYVLFNAEFLSSRTASPVPLMSVSRDVAPG